MVKITCTRHNNNVEYRNNILIITHSQILLWPLLSFYFQHNTTLSPMKWPETNVYVRQFIIRPVDFFHLPVPLAGEPKILISVQRMSVFY